MSPESAKTFNGLTAAGLFAGIGGLELGMAKAGITTRLLCEIWEPARAVLADRFAGIQLVPDVRELESLPTVDLVTAGFPCTDLSQAGRTAGITGAQSGLVGHVFRLLDNARTSPSWVVIENVRNMLPLDRGRAMHYLVEQFERRGYRWAYRVVDSRFSGVPQRRQRVLLVASRTEDPTGVLFCDDDGEPDESTYYRGDAYGFYWTEGVRGLGWAKDAVPTLKGGSTLGIPSPPAIWWPGRPLAERFGTPSMSDAERLQGFPAGWTRAADGGTRNGPRWRLVGNAVTVGVAAWLGRRLVEPGPTERECEPLPTGSSWPAAAWGDAGGRHRVSISMWPRRQRYTHLATLIRPDRIQPLSRRAAAGFLSRTARAKLRFDPEFLFDLGRFVDA